MKANMFLIYVSDIGQSTKFYSELFDMQASMVTRSYAKFEIAPGVFFALWSSRGKDLTPETPRSSELIFSTDGCADEINALFSKWKEKASIVVEEPHDETFGRTFLIADPDGNLIRVAPKGN